MSEVPVWGIREIVCPGAAAGNPFTDYDIVGEFSCGGETLRVPGFYDGDGRYIVRMMPSCEGEYTYRISGSFSPEIFTGSFLAVRPQPDVHGPVRVKDTYHFAYADGTRYMPVGTTCYVWHLQTPELFEQTLSTLSGSGFNKIRFCVFPKHYDYNHNEPFAYPFEAAEPVGEAPFGWDFARFNPVYFRHLEKAILRLGVLGIEADLIILHPYDRWGFSRMTLEENLRYFRYLATRLSAFRNVWWSLANEYDVLTGRTQDDWEAYAAALGEQDPYGHLTSIHNGPELYDYTRPWITHCCIQRQDIYLTAEHTDTWRRQYGKPVIVDEMGYEGNIQHGWGNISAEEITRRFWEATVRGGYGGHGETYLHESNLLWWSHGGVLRGDSPARLSFLRRFLDGLPAPLMRAEAGWAELLAIPEGCKEDAPPCMLYYYSFMRPGFRDYTLPKGARYRVEVIDTWNMTRDDRGVFKGSFRLPLPGRSMMAVYMRRID